MTEEVRFATAFFDRISSKGLASAESKKTISFSATISSAGGDRGDFPNFAKVASFTTSFCTFANVIEIDESTDISALFPGLLLL